MTEVNKPNSEVVLRREIDFSFEKMNAMADIFI